MFHFGLWPYDIWRMYVLVQSVICPEQWHCTMNSSITHCLLVGEVYYGKVLPAANLFLSKGNTIVVRQHNDDLTSHGGRRQQYVFPSQNAI